MYVRIRNLLAPSHLHVEMFFERGAGRIIYLIRTTFCRRIEAGALFAVTLRKNYIGLSPLFTPLIRNDRWNCPYCRFIAEESHGISVYDLHNQSPTTAILPHFSVVLRPSSFSSPLRPKSKPCRPSFALPFACCSPPLLTRVFTPRECLPQRQAASLTRPPVRGRADGGAVKRGTILR